MTNSSRNQISKGMRESWVAAVQINLEGKSPQPNTVKRIVNAFFDSKLREATRNIRINPELNNSIPLTDEAFLCDDQVMDAVKSVLENDAS